MKKYHFYYHLGKITYTDSKKSECNKQEPAKSLRFHHGARHFGNVQSEVRKVLAFALYLVLNRVKMASKTKGQFVSVGFITNWNFEMLAAMMQ